jgi:hypothetical protein
MRSMHHLCLSLKPVCVSLLCFIQLAQISAL